MKLEQITTVGANFANAKITRVKKTKYGFAVQMFNPYVIEYYLKIHVFETKFKIHWLRKMNYKADERFTNYWIITGEQIDLKQYKKL